jgi:hypothetical protein
MAITPLPTPPSRKAPSTFSTLADAFLGALPTFVTEANAQAAALELNDTTDASASSATISTGAKTFVVTAGKSFQPGMSLMIADDAAPSTNWMHGQVTSYSGTTLVMNITAIGGSGTKTAWTITFSAPTGLPTATAESDMLFAAPTSFSWIKKTLAEAKTILGLLSNVPAATAESDFIVSGGSPFAWVKKTLLEVKALIGLVPQAIGFTLAGGTSSKTLTVAETMTLTGYATAAEITAGTEPAKAIAPDQLKLSSPTFANITDSGLTASQMVCTDADKKLVSKPFTFTRGGTLVNTVDYVAAMNVGVWYATCACTVTNVRGYRVGGDSSVAINARRNGSATKHLNTDKTLANADTWYDGGNVQDITYAVGDKLEIMVTVASGNPTQVAIQVDFVKI